MAISLSAAAARHVTRYPKSLAYIDGTELDFVREGLNEGFRFNNPNERDRCGCGESFRV
jgi:iron-sulfur cluster assembly protein